jgi:hypothetical protein
MKIRISIITSKAAEILLNSMNKEADIASLKTPIYIIDMKTRK